MSKPTQTYEQYVSEITKQLNASMVLSLPLPPLGCTAQQGVHRFVKSAATKQYREQARMTAFTQRLRPFTSKVRIHHVWFCAKNPYEAAGGAQCKKKHKMYRPVDTANALQALKGAIDGLVDAGLFVDDKAANVCWGEHIRLGTTKENFGKCGLLLFIEVVS